MSFTPTPLDRFAHYVDEYDLGGTPDQFAGIVEDGTDCLPWPMTSSHLDEFPFLLIERCDARHHVTLWQTGDAAAQYHVRQECAADWTVSEFVDLRDGTEMFVDGMARAYGAPTIDTDPTPAAGIERPGVIHPRPNVDVETDACGRRIVTIGDGLKSTRLHDDEAMILARTILDLLGESDTPAESSPWVVL